MKPHKKNCNIESKHQTVFEGSYQSQPQSVLVMSSHKLNTDFLQTEYLVLWLFSNNCSSKIGFIGSENHFAQISLVLIYFKHHWQNRDKVWKFGVWKITYFHTSTWEKGNRKIGTDLKGISDT